MSQYNIGRSATRTLNSLQAAFDLASKTSPTDDVNEFILDGDTWVDSGAWSNLSGVIIRALGGKGVQPSEIRGNRGESFNHAGVPQSWTDGAALDKQGHALIASAVASKDWTFIGLALTGSYIGAVNDAACIYFPGSGKLTIQGCEISDAQ